MNLNLITVSVLLFVSGLSGMIIFLMHQQKADKKTWWYALGMAFTSAMVALLMWVFRSLAGMPLEWAFGISMLAFLGLGFFHQWMLYRLFWSVRDSNMWLRDSVLKEAAFSVFLSQLVALVFILSLYGLFRLSNWANMEESFVYWGLFLPFLLPFIGLKLFDLYQHIPAREFEKQWFYDLTEFDPNSWNWHNKMLIQFQVVDAFANEKNWFDKRARFTIEAPRDQPLALVYRLALQVYHSKDPSVPLQDIGNEDEYYFNPQFWWLFYVEFRLFSPKTWFPKTKYLDPYASLQSNQLQTGDIIRARRIPDYRP